MLLMREGRTISKKKGNGYSKARLEDRNLLIPLFGLKARRKSPCSGMTAGTTRLAQPGWPSAWDWACS